MLNEVPSFSIDYLRINVGLDQRKRREGELRLTLQSCRCASHNQIS